MKIMTPLYTFFKRKANSFWNRYIFSPPLQKHYGEKLYKKILSEKSDRSTVIFTGPGLGDTLYAMAYLHEYKAAHPDRRTVVVAPSSTIQVVESFRGGWILASF